MAAQTSIDKLPPTGIPLVDALTNGTYWMLDASRSLTWAIADMPAPDWAWSAQGAQTMREAYGSVLAMYAEVANLHFNYTAWYDDFFAAPADLVLGATLRPEQGFGVPSGVYAWAHFPNEPMTDAEIAATYGSADVWPNASGDLVLNMANAEMSGSTYQPGSNGYFALIHETGHALGLKHPHDDGGTPGRPTFADLDYTAADTQLLTVMSYDPATELAAWLQRYGIPAEAGYPRTLMPLDVIAIQALYGPNTSTRAGDTVYELYNDEAIETYWDAGGTDEVTAEHSSFGWQVFAISTTPGSNIVVAVPDDWNSNTGKFYFNVENLTGSPWDDALVGSDEANDLFGLAGNDHLQGGGGDDLLAGGTGRDSAYWDGRWSDYLVRLGDVADDVTDLVGGDGTDLLYDVERLIFADYALARDTGIAEHGGQAAAILRALFGPAYLDVPEYVGIGIGLLDQGMSFGDLVALAVASQAFAERAGSRSNDAFVRLVFDNVVGRPPFGDELGYYRGLLDAHVYTQAELGSLAALADLNVYSADLVGLGSTGIVYLPLDGGG